MLNRSYINGHEGHPHYLANNKITSLTKRFQGYKNQEDLLKIVKALSDPTKFSIYFLLQSVEEIPVSDISQILGISQSAASHALSDLRKVGLVKSRRCGQCICYFLLTNKKKNRVSDFINLFQTK